MSAQPCLPQEIIEVNRNKEYTLISTELLESVLTDTRLTAQTSKLWQILFNKARYNPNLEIKISYSYLASKLNKSTRTIARYVESLQNAGYLIVQHNFDTNGGQRPSTISVRVPTVFIEHANKKKDRVNKKHYDNNDSLVALDTRKKVSRNKIVYEENPVSVSFPDSNNTSVLCGTICNIQVEPEVDSAVTPESHTNSEIQSTAILLHNPDKILNLIGTQDKNDMGGYDINVVQKDTNKKEINKNNNVVSRSQEKQKIVAIQDQMDDLKKQLAEENKKLSAIKDKTLLYDQIKLFFQCQKIRE